MKVYQAWEIYLNKELPEDTEVVLKSDFDDLAKTFSSCPECGVEFTVDGDAISYLKIQRQEVEIRMLRSKLDERMRWDVANYLRGTSTYSPSAIEAELKNRWESLDNEISEKEKEAVK